MSAEKFQGGREQYAKERQELLQRIYRLGVGTCFNQAFAKVDRGDFTPHSQRDRAYKNEVIPLGHNSSLSEPILVARMIQQLDIQPWDRVLEVGTASGYTAALLGQCAKEVYSVEVQPELAASAERRLTELGLNSNIQIKAGDGAQGWQEYAPFDAIAVWAEAPDIPQSLIDQLARRGRIIIPIGFPRNKLLFGKKLPEELYIRWLDPVSFVPLTQG